VLDVLLHICVLVEEAIAGLNAGTSHLASRALDADRSDLAKMANT
jgi:hypothetical protein